MEFSEPFELQSILKIDCVPSKNIFASALPLCSDQVERMINLTKSIEDCLNYSPSSSVPSIIIRSEALEPPSPPQRHDPNPEYQENPRRHSAAHPNNAHQSDIEVTRDESFMESYAQSIQLMSTLTRSLKNDDGFMGPSSDMAELKIFLFKTSDFLRVYVQKTNTVEQLISKVLNQYTKSGYNNSRPLNNGTKPDGYEIWLVEDDGYLPDTDFIVERSMIIADLAVDSLALCEVEDYQIEIVSSAGPLRRISQISNGIALKVNFEENWTIVSVSPMCKLSDLLTILEKKFQDIGYLNPEDYEFRIEVTLEEDFMQEECIVDMNLTIDSVGTTQLRLCKKTYADAPVETAPPVKPRRETLYKEDEEVKYDPTRFNLTRAQACAYKEFEVIKVNHRNKRQRRILGIDQLCLYNLTKAQAQQALRQREGKAKNVMRNKLEGLFRNITHHPEIPISNVLAVQQMKDLKTFTIDYSEDGARKSKLYETDNSQTAAEIVAKISKLMMLNISDNI